ncbi:MAG: SPOR domain-containing protein [Rhodothermales bacterium]
MRSILPALAFVVLFLVAGCSGARDTTTVAPPETGPTMSEILQRLDEYEDFDVSLYPNELIETNVELEHLVPDELMENRAGDGDGASRRGYRIQLVFARDKETADNSVQEVIDWWHEQQNLRPNDPLFRGELPVHNIYQQPYYRVRIGDFNSRADAEMLLNLVIEDYPRAFIVVDAIGQD